jgi:hypothetical protein
VGVSALIVVLLAAPPLSLDVAFGGGYGYAHRAGMYRDDDVFTLRAGLGVGRHFAVDFGFSEDTARIEPAIRIGTRVRPFAPSFWTDRWSPYVRGELAIVGGSHLSSNYDFVIGFGNWGRIWHWLAWFAEIDLVPRVGEVDTMAVRFDAGLAVTTRTFWPSPK